MIHRDLLLTAGVRVRIARAKNYLLCNLPALRPCRVEIANLLSVKMCLMSCIFYFCNSSVSCVQ